MPGNKPMPALLPPKTRKCRRTNKAVVLKHAWQPTRQALTTSHHTHSQISTKDREISIWAALHMPSHAWACRHQCEEPSLVPLGWADLGKLLGGAWSWAGRWWGRGVKGERKEKRNLQRGKGRIRKADSGVPTKVLRASAAGLCQQEDGDWARGE